ncbi:hypothetical protein RIF29_21999 [Crotalaria pallida]|uniref:Uncharacterized protein n=1 Tax=Crotalaria pallida TaxID=3830 RepID=A0AAN9F3U8_CROPI
MPFFTFVAVTITFKPVIQIVAKKIFVRYFLCHGKYIKSKCRPFIALRLNAQEMSCDFFTNHFQAQWIKELKNSSNKLITGNTRIPNTSKL